MLITLILILAQVIVLDHVCLWGVAVPMAFIYVILRLPLTLHLNYVLSVQLPFGTDH